MSAGSSRANKCPASRPNPWASLAVWPNGRSVEVVGEGVFPQRHVQPLIIPRAHKVCEYSFGNRHCPQWISLNSRWLVSALDKAGNAVDLGVVGEVAEDGVASLGVEGNMETGVEGVEGERMASIAPETMGAERADMILECEEGIWWLIEEKGIISSILALLLLTPFFFGSACFCFFLLYSTISLSA